MVRHGESPYSEGNERTRGLTDKGKADAKRVAELLKSEEIDIFTSSPYQRAILTVEELAQHAGKEVILFEDLKERVFSTEDYRIPDEELMPLLDRSFAEPSYALPTGESNAECQQRAVTVLQQLLRTYQGQKIAIGTHGAVMTLMMGHYDPQYDLNFLLHTSKPDVYRMEFHGEALVGVERMWSGN